MIDFFKTNRLLLFLAVLSCFQYAAAGIRPSRDVIMRMNPGLKVLVNGYSNDSMKKAAALFLIDNIAFHGGLEGKEVDAVHKTYEIYSSNKDITPKQAKDSVKQIYGIWNTKNLVTKSDVKIDYRIIQRNIDFAFKIWEECPWKDSISFDTFCEYVLPYRIGNESVTYWREKVFYQYKHLFESLKKDPKARSIKYAAQKVLDYLVSKPIRFTEDISTDVYPGPEIVKWRVGSCLDLTVMTVYVFRALGLPCTIEMMLIRGDNNVAHYWNATIDGDKKEWFFSPLYAKKVLESPDTYWNPKGKVWRITFSLNEEMAKDFGIPQEKVHPTFSYPLMVDVTSHYAGKFNWGIHIPCSKFLSHYSEGELIYLCLSSRLGWYPVGYGHIKNDSVNIRNAEGGVVYALATYKENHINLVTDPFLLERKRNVVRYFSPMKEKNKITILHKFNLFIEPFINRMVNGVFEGTNNSDFSNADTLFVIREKPVRLLNMCSINVDKSYRYLRYVGPTNGYCDISEITFYSSDEATVLSGTIIGPQEGALGTHSYYNVFDGNPYTSYHYDAPNGGWVGLDLGEPKRVGKIVFTPRNRDNFIRKNDVYELFFLHESKWKSAGICKAESDSIVYEVPKNALLELKNHSRGVDERIFEYKDGKQIFY